MAPDPDVGAELEISDGQSLLPVLSVSTAVKPTSSLTWEVLLRDITWGFAQSIFFYCTNFTKMHYPQQNTIQDSVWDGRMQKV